MHMKKLNNVKTLDVADLLICAAALQDKMSEIYEKIQVATDDEQKEKLLKTKRVYESVYSKIK